MYYLEPDTCDAIEDVGRRVLHNLSFKLDHTAGTIFLTGGHGVLTYRVASRLLRAGYPTVRIGSLHADDLSDLNQLGAEIADFSWGKDETYKTALSGVKTVFCTPPYLEDWDEVFDEFLAACQEAGVKHIVKVSFLHADKPDDDLQEVPLVRMHGMCDKGLIQSGIAYTIIAPSHLMSNPLFQAAKSGEKPAKLYGASAGKAVNYISPNDVAEVAVRTLLAPTDHVDKIYELTGPMSIKEENVVHHLSKFMGRPVVYVDRPLAFFQVEEQQSGAPLWLLHDIVSLEKIKSLGHEGYTSFLSSDVENVCNHKPETFVDYLADVDAMSPRERSLAA